MSDFLWKFLYVFLIIFSKKLIKYFANLLIKWTNDIKIYAQGYLHENAGSINVSICPKISAHFLIIFPKNLIKNSANFLNKWTNDINLRTALPTRKWLQYQWQIFSESFCMFTNNFPENLIKNFAKLLNKRKNDVNSNVKRYLHINGGSINIWIFPKISVVFPIIFPKICEARNVERSEFLSSPQ